MKRKNSRRSNAISRRRIRKTKGRRRSGREGKEELEEEQIKKKQRNRRINRSVGGREAVEVERRREI